MGAVPTVRIGDKTLFLSRSRILNKIFARYDSVTNTGNASLYGLQKYDIKYGLGVHIKYKGRFKSQLYIENTFFYLNHKVNMKVFLLLDLVISLRKVVYRHIICGNM